MRDKDIDFISGHYRKGRFVTSVGWKRLGIKPVSRWKRIAAAVTVMVVISATAAIIYHEYQTDESLQQKVETQVISPLTEVKVIDFENASLSEVVKKIEAVYNVKVDNLPELSEEYELSLHYEGTPTDLISVINDILGTQMTVAEK